MIPHQPARRVALPSSPAETLRLCEPYADTEYAWNALTVTILPLLQGQASTGAKERHYVSTTPSGTFVKSHTLRQDQRPKNSRPHGGGSTGMPYLKLG